MISEGAVFDPGFDGNKSAALAFPLTPNNLAIQKPRQV